MLRSKENHSKGEGCIQMIRIKIDKKVGNIMIRITHDTSGFKTPLAPSWFFAQRTTNTKFKDCNKYRDFLLLFIFYNELRLTSIPVGEPIR